MSAITLRHSHTSDSQLLKEINETRLLTLVSRHGPLSRASIAKQAHMAKATVSEIISRLLEAGLVEEIGKGDSTSRGGKRPTLIQLRASGRFLFGIDIKREQTHLQLTNLLGEEIEFEALHYALGTPMDAVLERTMTAMERMLQTHEIAPQLLLAIGISIPGLVDYRRGELWMADTLPGWDHHPVNKRFEERFSVPCMVENDVNCTTWGERLNGVGVGSQGDQICIFLGDGIGAGIVHDQHIVRGNAGGAGEIGYIEVHCPALPKDGYLFNGQRFYGELLGIASLIRACIKAGVAEEGESLETILRKNRSGLETVLNEYALALASLTQNLVKTLNPESVIIAGKPVEFSPYLVEKVREYVDLGLKASALHIEVELRIGTLGTRAALAGAVAMAKQTLFKPVIAQHFTPAMSFEGTVAV